MFLHPFPYRCWVLMTWTTGRYAGATRKVDSRYMGATAQEALACAKEYRPLNSTYTNSTGTRVVVGYKVFKSPQRRES